MDKVFEYLEANNIDVLRMDDDDEGPDDADLMLTDEDEVDMEKIDLSVPRRHQHRGPRCACT